MLYAICYMMYTVCEQFWISIIWICNNELDIFFILMHSILFKMSYYVLLTYIEIYRYCRTTTKYNCDKVRRGCGISNISNDL